MNQEGMPPMNAFPQPDADLNRTRHWIAKCLVMGRKLEYIRGSLLEKGLPTSVVDAEIKLAQESPYIKGGRTVYKRDIQDVKQKAETTSTPKQNQYPAAPLCAPLEAGDYVPNFIALGKGHRKLDIQSKAHRKITLVLPSIKSTKEDLRRLIKECQSDTTFIITSSNQKEEIEPNQFNATGLKQLFAPQDVHHIIQLGLNLKIESIQTAKTLHVAESQARIKKTIDSQKDQKHPAPVLVVPDVISTDLCQRLIDCGMSNWNEGHIVDRPNKSRFHIAPSPSLIKELDDKLCRSLLPEIEKTFYSSISHRETYKICHYDASRGGNFAVHRDTIDPYRHRRYGFSLALNDEFNGGGINFPEYNDSIINVKPGSALVFPGSLFHQVATIQEGHRWVLISFLFTEAEARKGKDESNRFIYRNRFQQLNLQSILPKKQQ